MPKIDMPEGMWTSLDLLKRTYPDLEITFPLSSKGKIEYWANTGHMRIEGDPDYIVRVELSMPDDDTKYAVLLPFWSMGGKPNVTECTLMETLFRWRNSDQQARGCRSQHEQSDRPS